MAARAALGFSVHTGWAVLVAVGPPAVILLRRRIEMMANDPELPRFVYHASQDRPLAVSERRIAQSRARSLANARAAIEAAVAELDAEVTAAGVIVANQPFAPQPLAAILASHSLIHSAEGALFRAAIRDACAALGIPTVDLRARDLAPRAGKLLGVDAARHLEAVGKAAGRPWAKDQKDACLAATIALGATSRGSR